MLTQLELNNIHSIQVTYYNSLILKVRSEGIKVSNKV
jgi:hypothetical protein